MRFRTSCLEPDVFLDLKMSDAGTKDGLCGEAERLTISEVERNDEITAKASEML